MIEKVSSLSFTAVMTDGSGARNTGMAHIIDPNNGGSVGVVTFPNGKTAVGSIH